MSAPATWRPGEIPISGVGGPYRVAGWVSDLFGLDYRPVSVNCFGVGEGAWALTHLRTGRILIAIRGDFGTAALAAAAVATWGDWSFEDPEIICKFAGLLPALSKRFPDAIFHPALTPLTMHMVAPDALARRFMMNAVAADEEAQG